MILELYFNQLGVEPAEKLAASWSGSHQDLRSGVLEVMVGYYQRTIERSNLIEAVEKLIALEPRNSKLLCDAGDSIRIRHQARQGARP